jgi:retron-type reverse transcriptase
MVFLKLGGVREVKDILRNFALGISKDQLINMYNYATDEKLDCLLLDLEADKTKKFRKNFDEYMNPDDYGEAED